MAHFRVRLNCVDHYQATPLEFDPLLPPSFRQELDGKRPKVPVIRVFGATETGQKVCAHIHGAFPYLYIRYTGPLNTNDVDAHMHQLHLSIDHALAVSYRRNTYGGKSSFVALITFVKGVPFYGYHVGYEYFLKIYMLDPLYMTRLADLLRQGAILKRVIQPFESHMQYIAQWMCDYNLFGCAYLDCKEVKFRAPIPDYIEMTDPGGRWHNRSISQDLVSDGSKVPRQSHCSIEIDVCVHHIQNRENIKPRLLHHDFVERKTSIVFDEKLVHSMAGLWRDETRRRKARLGMADSDSSSPFPPEVLVSVSADPRNLQAGGWIHEQEYRAKMEQITKDERLSSGGHDIQFDSLIDKDAFEDHVKTSLESVEDLYPENLAQLSASQHAYQTVSQNAQLARPEVDESRLQDLDDDDFHFNSDEESGQELNFSRKRSGDGADEQMTEYAIDALKIPNYQGNDESVDSGKEQGSYDQVDIDGVQHGQGPTSSTELEKLGIKIVGDLTLFKDDAFHVSGDCTSDFGTDGASIFDAGKLKPSKRRKILSHPHLECINASDRDQGFDQKINSRQRIGDGRGWRNELREAEKPRARDLKQLQELNDETFKDLKDASQSSLKETGNIARNAKLPYTIVKDPHDPMTILKLSQQSNSSSKKSHKSEIQSKSFTDSSESNPRTSSCHDNSASILAETPEYLSPRFHQRFSQLRTTFDINRKCQLVCVAQASPSSMEMQAQMDNDGIPSMIYQDAFYSDDKDVPERSREYAGKDYRLESGAVPFLPKFNSTGYSSLNTGVTLHTVVDRLSQDAIYARRRRICTSQTWEYKAVPPKRIEVQEWLQEEIEHSAISQLDKGDPDTLKENISQVEGATQTNRHGFKYSQKKKSTSVRHETQYMSIMGLELHVNTRANLVPNPEQDEVCCLFWCVQSDDEDLEVNGVNEGCHVGVLVLSESGTMAPRISQRVDIEVEQESSELDLINRFVDIVRSYDPDIMTGYEVHGSSWGYLIERARCKYDYDLCDELSRTISNSHGRFGKEDDRWGFNHTSTIRVTGRHMINIWRAMRGELNLLQYTMENVVFQLCHRRVPHYSFQDLTRWYSSGKPQDLSKVVDYYLSRVQLDIEILEQNELVPRTSEQARLLGVDFYSVFSRGSQFKVESLMFRIAKPENLLLPSPSRKQVGQQNALECLPLVMEPRSAFYNNPVLVLDFQSLYPSVMIAYNYCYSTFLGRVVGWRGQNKMGFTDYQRKPRLLELLDDQINIAPNGIMYAKTGVRKSLLAKMLGEILETRVMVKSGMKVDKNDRTLQRLLNNRQLALKLIANVTYGYTSASFSGRMPCSEIADSIVQTGRETLEKAIALIHSVERWGAEVVYGDTDSLFVHLRGRSKDEAFDIGEEIAKTITEINPRPIKLKFEKVYLPCILLAKKRYVGFKYENKQQRVPDFDAKGIETIRRDGTPAEQKMEETAIKMLFRTADLTQVKKSVQRQFSKIMRGKVSIQDFCFAKEVKLGTYSDKGIPPPGALISTRRMLKDPRAEPQYGERVSYVVIAGAPGARLIDRCVAPAVLLHDDNNELDAEYYISKNLIPPLERIFNLVGANVRQWYDEMPKYQRIRRIDAKMNSSGKDTVNMKKTLESYLKSTACLVCSTKLEEDSAICNGCLEDPDISTFRLQSRLSKAETKAMNLHKVCRSCSGLAWGENVCCDSQDCPVYYSRTRQMAKLRNLHLESRPILDLLKEEGREPMDCSPVDLDVMTYLDTLIIYLIGGLTFLPLLLLAIFLHAIFTFPVKAAASDSLEQSSESLFSNDDDKYEIKSGRSLHDLAERFQRHHESDVASGYFAVCREYVPGGVNGKPPERTTPAGIVIAAESPSVYQSMYRSLFDRKQPPTIHPGQENGKTVKRARNIFFVVLRHGHLMLYADSDQVEVKYVIAIDQYHVSIYSGEDNIPEGELWIKRNAIRLSRKAGISDDAPKPFYFFSENCSDKEDFYIALLQNQDQSAGAPEKSAKPLRFDPKLAIGLVQRLHSTEEQMQTRWLNAMAGRLFLALYQTAEVEDFVRKKITKKIARAKKPTILSDIVLRSIDMGDSAPQITNPRLKDLTIDGDCCTEMDIKYSGGFRLEIATTARIDLGARFKAREVTIILAVVLKKLNGHCLVKFKPPPSNRMWISFEAMPDMDMIIEPLVSSRQITYGFILRTIEARIREVLAETIVLPHWDDIPFTDTSTEEFRGGIWAPRESQPTESANQTAIPDEALEDEIDIDVDKAATATFSESKNERIMSTPTLQDAHPLNETNNAAVTSVQSLVDLDSSSTNLQKGPVPPKALRSRSFASAANPLLNMDNANVDSLLVEQNGRGKKQSVDATSAMRTISNKSRPSSPPESTLPSALDIPSPQAKSLTNGEKSSTTSHSSGDSRSGIPSSVISSDPDEAESSPIYTNISSHSSQAARSNTMPKDVQAENRTVSSFSDRKQAVAAVNAATAAAKKWSWGVLNRNNNSEQRKGSGPSQNGAGSPARPIGRGQPLPPPGQPLPFPEGQRPKTNVGLMGKRKPVPPPFPSQQSDAKFSEETKVRSTPTPPPLPARRRQSALLIDDTGMEGMLVVEAPPGSDPASPNDKEETSSNEKLQLPDRMDHGHEDEASTEAPPSGTGGDQQIVDFPRDADKGSLSEDESIAAWQDT